MKTVRNSLFFSLLLLSMVLVTLVGFVAERDAGRAIASQSNSLTLDEAAPELVAVAEGATVALGWTEVLGAKGYRLLFSFNYGDTADEPYEIDMGHDTELTLDFDNEAILDTFDNLGSCETIEAGLTFYVRVEAYDQEGNSRQSNVKYVLVGANDYRSQGDDTVGGGEQPSTVSARVACTFPVQPTDSCVAILHGIHICVPVGGTAGFTPNGSINGYTPISRDPSITTCGYDSGRGWVTGISEGITIVDIWNSAGCLTPMTVQVMPPGAYYIYVSYLDPAPYPASSLTAGARVTISCVLHFPGLSEIAYLAINGFYGRWASATEADSEISPQVMETQKLKSMINASESSQAYSATVDVLTGYDYLVVWFEALASDGTTVLARTCSTGWLTE